MISLGILRQSDTPEFSSSGQFDLLAIEIIENIFGCLPGRDLITSLRLNKTLNIVILNSTELQYRIALCAYGMVDGHSSMSTKDKLAELLRREENWQTLDLTHQNPEPDQCHASTIFRFQEGVLVGDIRGSGEEWNLRVCDISTCQNHKDDSRFYFRNLPTFSGRILAVGLAIEEHDLICIVQARETSVLFNSLSCVGSYSLFLQRRSWERDNYSSETVFDKRFASSRNECRIYYGVCGVHSRILRRTSRYSWTMVDAAFVRERRRHRRRHRNCSSRRTFTNALVKRRNCHRKSLATCFVICIALTKHR